MLRMAGNSLELPGIEYGKRVAMAGKGGRFPHFDSHNLECVLSYCATQKLAIFMCANPGRSPRHERAAAKSANILIHRQDDAVGQLQTQIHAT